MSGRSREPEEHDPRSDKPPLVARGPGAMPPARLRQLPAGRHGTDGLDPDPVASIQRKRLRRALVAAAAQRDCDAITVETVCKLAGVSRRTLYDRFNGGVAACLHSTCHTVLNATARQISEMLGHGGQWHEQLLRFVAALTCSIAENPDAARLVLINAHDMPTSSIPPIVHGTELLEDQLKACFTDVLSRQTPPPLVIKGIVLGIFHVARTHLLAGREQDLPAQAPVLAEWARQTCDLQSGKPPHCHAFTAPDRPGRTWWTAAFAAEGDQPGGEERAALQDACARLVCEHGLAQLQPSQISAAAGLRRGTLHTHFADPSECLLAAYERLVGAALSEALENAVETADSLQSAIAHSMVDDLIATLSGDDHFAKLAFCEILRISA